MSVLTTAGKNQLLDAIDGTSTTLTWYLDPFNGDRPAPGHLWLARPLRAARK